MSDLSHPDSINRDYIRLLQVMRRFVREEFSVSIRMTQEDAIEQLLHYSGQSRNHVLQEMAKELQEFTRSEEVATTEEAGEEAPKGNVRYYRGAAVLVEDEEPTSQASAPVAKKPEPQSGSKRIYRGRVIN